MISRQVHLFLTGCVLLILLLGCGRTQHDDAFVRLQKDIFSGHISDREEIIDRVLSLFRAIPVPDSLAQQLSHSARKAAVRIHGERPRQETGHQKGSDFERAENRLSALLKKYVATIAISDSNRARNLLKSARHILENYPQRPGKEYWQAVFSDMALQDSSKAKHWMQAWQAQLLTRRYARRPAGKLYAALGLQHIEHVADPRLRAVLYQRIQLVLYKQMNLNELARHLGEHALELARAADDQLRINSIQYDIAASLLYTGEASGAVSLFTETQSRAERYPYLKSMNFFTRTGRLAYLTALIDAGDYRTARQLLQRLDYEHLSARNKINFHNSAARLFRSEGKYAQAVKEYSEGLALAELEHDASNTFTLLHNLGALYQSLREYDKAALYYQRADSLIRARMPHDNQKQVTLATSLLEFYSATDNRDAFESTVERTRALVERIDSPLERAMVERSLGQFYLKSRRYGDAVAYLTSAAQTLQASGMARRKLPVDLDLARALFFQQQYSEALATVTAARQLASRIRDHERYIDALGLAAEIHAARGEYSLAITLSDSLIGEVRNLGNRISSAHLRTMLRERIYRYLKKAVLYEASAGNRDRAWEKLAFAKSGMLADRELLTAKNGLAAADRIGQSLPAAGDLVIDYLLVADTLFAFYADPSGRGMLRHEVEQDTLLHAVQQFRNMLARPPANANDLSSTDLEKLMNTGFFIYRHLFSWPELEAKTLKARRTYIIPDEGLHDLAFAALPVDTLTEPRFLVHNTAVSIVMAYDQKQADQKFFEQPRILVSADYEFRGAREFVRELKKTFPHVTEIRITRDGDPVAQLQAELRKNYSVYIFLNHGQADQQFPENSYIDVACRTEDTGKQKKVRLRAAELENLSWSKTDLVYLIGCETAAGKTYNASGIFGLQKLFLLNGAQTVIGNLWQVDAAQAIPQATALLQRLARGGIPEVSLRHVQLETIDELSANPYFGFPYPYFWGSQIIARNNRYRH